MERSILIDANSYFLTSDDNYLANMGESFEPHMVELFKTLIEPDNVVLDIGANIGLTSILFSNLAIKVYAFEPSPSTYQILQENLSRAQVDNVLAINIGCGEQEEQLSITFSTNNRSGGFVSDRIQLKEGHITEQIQIDSLDHYFSENAEKIAFLKIDVEGFEENVIKGAQILLEKFKPIVTLELNHFCLNVFRRTSVPDFFDFLRSVFPYLYAIDVDNAVICDLHDETQAYQVMHEHIVKFRFPNLVAGFDLSIDAKLKELERTARERLASTPPSKTLTPHVTDARGLLEVLNPPKVVEPWEEFFVDVSVLNESGCEWGATGDKPARLSYHWQDLNGNSVIHDGERSLIEIDVIKPGEEIRARMKIIAPPMAGQYQLIVTIVQDGVCWFENCGFRSDILNIAVCA